MPKPNKDTSSSLRAFLQAKVQQHQGTDSFIPVQELYREFISCGLDTAGALSSGYSEGGISLSFEAGVDAAKLAIPLGPVKLAAEAKLAGTRATRLLLIIQRQPDAPNKKPICFMRMSGRHWKASASFEAEAGIDVDVEKSTQVGPDEVALSFSFSAKALVTAKAGYRGDFLLLTDDEPLWYAAARDAELIQRFDEVAGENAKKQLKARAARLLEKHNYKPQKSRGRFGTYVTADLLEKLELVIDSQPAAPTLAEGLVKVDKANPRKKFGPVDKLMVDQQLDRASAEELKTKLRNIQSQDRTRVEREALSWLESNAPNALKDIGAPSTGGKPTTKGLISALRRAMGVAAAPTLAGYLDSANRQPVTVVQSDPGTADRLKEEAAALLDKLEVFDNTLPIITVAAANIAPPDNRCFLRLWGHGGGAGVEVEGKLVGSVTIHDHAGDASVTATAIANGAVKYTSYRYQSCTPREGGSQLIMTQDTTLTYKETRLQASANATLGSRVLADTDGKIPYHSLLYRSAVAFWKYPSSVSEAPAACLEGSGLCFGVSLQYSRLCKQLGSELSPESAYIKILAARLRVPPATLVDFINGSWVLKPNDRSDLPNDTIILESAWAAVPGYSVKVDAEGASHRPEDLLKKMTTDFADQNSAGNKNSKREFTLQSITCRYRIADMANDDKTLFKLGFPKPLEKIMPIKLGIYLRKVQEAGTDAVVDLDTWWVDPARKTTAKTDPTAAYEGAVPRVALFHQ